MRESALGSVFIFQKRGIGLDNYKSKESLSRVVMNQTFEDMKEIVRKNPFAQHIGMELLEVTEGYALGRIRLAKQYENI